ncbi:MAG TPA: DUF2889 domain-containing protein [bacterium]|nr:DUF2889 domain-containing protein [bacterium]
MVDQSKPVHVRDIHVECFTPAPDLLELRGKLRDERPQGMGTRGGESETIHGMDVVMKVRLPDFTILDIDVTMPHTPEAECREVREQYQRLKGERIASGFTRRAHELFPRVKTCPHVLTLILAMAPVAVQGSFVRFIEQAANALRDGTLDAAAMMEMSFEQWKNACYVSDENGPVVERMKERGMLYPLSEVAALIQVDYGELVKRAKRGEFPAAFENGKWVVRWQDLTPWFEKRKNQK